MPLKRQSTGTISGLQSFVSYSLNNRPLVEDISDMISYDVLEPEQPVDLQFVFGATKPIVKTFQFKNLTNNTNLQLEFTFDTTIFNAPSSITILPEQSASVDLRLNIGNMQFGITDRPVQFDVTVKNIKPASVGPLTLGASGSAAEPLLATPINNVITIYE